MCATTDLTVIGLIAVFVFGLLFGTGFIVAQRLFGKRAA